MKRKTQQIVKDKNNYAFHRHPSIVVTFMIDL